MNILLISPLPPPAGGIASWTKRYIASKKSKENNVFIVNTAVRGGRIEDFAKRRLTDEITRTFAIILNLKEQLSSNKIDIVHLNSPCGKVGIIRDYICARIVHKKKVKLITHFRCDVSYMIKSKFQLFFLKRLVKLTDLVLTLNKVSENFIINKCGKKTVTVPNFISDEYLDFLNLEKDHSDKIKNVLFAGHVIKSKGCELIYEVSKIFPDIDFILAGYISKEFKNKERPDNLHLLGELTTQQVMDEMIKADIFLFPTFTEGFPNAVSEAMACGLPIISTPVGAIPDMLENKGGTLVPVNNLDKIISAINDMQNLKLRKQMSQWNKKKVQCQYTIDNVMDKLYELYKEIVEGDV